MRRTAKLLSVDRVEMLDGSGPALEIRTNFADPANSAFYIDRDAPVPTDGSLRGTDVAYGDDHAWLWINGETVQVRKRGYNFNPDKPLGGDDQPVAQLWKG